MRFRPRVKEIPKVEREAKDRERCGEGAEELVDGGQKGEGSGKGLLSRESQLQAIYAIIARCPNTQNSVFSAEASCSHTCSTISVRWIGLAMR